MANTSSGFIDEVMALYEGLERLSYYDYLGVRPGCDYILVRDAYYARAQRFHPDRFVYHSGISVKRAVYAVYKRIAESYNVLSDPDARMAYDAARVRGDVRLSDVARARRRAADERGVHHPFARVYLRSARAKFERGEVVAAWIDVQLGRSLELNRAFGVLLEQILRHPDAAHLAGAR